MNLAIVLASYNGATYIEDQIRSIQNQTIDAWKLYVRDDGSRDATVEVVAKLAAGDDRIILLQDQLGNLGPVGNFSELMRVALERGADYVAFADQDDIWLPEKLQVLLSEMQRQEEVCGQGDLLLVHSDLEVVNASLQTIHPSFIRLISVHPQEVDLGVLLCQNVVTGCACMVNRELMNLALPIPQGVLMHDWWLAQLAAACGHIAYIDQALIKYRQHGENVVGAESYLKRVFKFSIMRSRQQKHIRVVLQSIRQADSLMVRLEKCGVKLDKSILEMVRGYSLLPGLSWIAKLRTVSKYKIRKQAWLSNLFFRILVAGLPHGK